MLLLRIKLLLAFYYNVRRLHDATAKDHDFQDDRGLKSILVILFLNGTVFWT